MKTSKFTDEHIAFTLKQVELGTPVKEAIRKTCILFTNSITGESRIWSMNAGKMTGSYDLDRTGSLFRLADISYEFVEDRPRWELHPLFRYG